MSNTVSTPLPGVPVEAATAASPIRRASGSITSTFPGSGEGIPRLTAAREWGRQR